MYIHGNNRHENTCQDGVGSIFITYQQPGCIKTEQANTADKLFKVGAKTPERYQVLHVKDHTVTMNVDNVHCMVSIDRVTLARSVNKMEALSPKTIYAMERYVCDPIAIP